MAHSSTTGDHPQNARSITRAAHGQEYVVWTASSRIFQNGARRVFVGWETWKEIQRRWWGGRRVGGRLDFRSRAVSGFVCRAWRKLWCCGDAGLAVNDEGWGACRREINLQICFKRVQEVSSSVRTYTTHVRAKQWKNCVLVVGENS